MLSGQASGLHVQSPWHNHQYCEKETKENQYFSILLKKRFQIPLVIFVVVLWKINDSNRLLPENLILAYRFQMADSITTWSYGREKGVLEKIQHFLMQRISHFIISLVHRELPKPWKNIRLKQSRYSQSNRSCCTAKICPLDLVHTQLCRNVEFGTCQIKIKFKCFQLDVVYDVPFSHSDSLPSFSKVFCIGGNIN